MLQTYSTIKMLWRFTGIDFTTLKNCSCELTRPNKNVSVFCVKSLKILGRVGSHIFFKLFFFLEKNILCILKGILPFKMHKFIFFSENLKKILGFTSKFR